jgi:FkbM family methyltransferase
MKNRIKILLTWIISSIVKWMGRFKAIEFLYEQVLRFSINRTTIVIQDGVDFIFAVPNSISRWRASSFSSKEPETLEWINTIPEGAVLWDIGANIGLYSVYAAKKRNINVIAFEPSVFNMEILARNVYLNKLTEKICIVPLALSSQISISEMKMTSTEWGGALSTFGENFGWDGEPIKETFKYQLIGLDMESAVSKLEITSPEYIKMDVDGLEHFILKGGKEVLAKIKSILIEVNDDFIEQAQQCELLLSSAGLQLKEKRHSEEIDHSDSGFQNTFNQIWIRP